MGHPKGLRLPFALPHLLEELRRAGRSPPEFSSRERRSFFIRKVYETDPLTCPKYQGEVSIVSFVDRLAVIRKILLCGLSALLVPSRQQVPNRHERHNAPDRPCPPDEIRKKKRRAEFSKKLHAH